MNQQSLRMTLAAGIIGLGVLTANATTVSVTANPLWTDTGIHLSLGSVVNVTATGMWNSGGGLMSASGYVPGVQDDQFVAGRHGNLIAYVGTDPFQGHWGVGSFWPQSVNYWVINTGAEFTSTAAGELWLGMNDASNSSAGMYDNSGSLSAQITIVPEPSCPRLHLPWHRPVLRKKCWQNAQERLEPDCRGSKQPSREGVVPES